MARRFLVISALFLFATFAFVFVFYWPQLRPALGPAPKDITEIIPDKPPVTPEAENKTDFPLKLPKGFSISIFAKNLGAPRVLVEDPYGNIVASITSKGRVVALRDTNGDGVSDETVTVADGLRKPHGLAFRCKDGKCALYIAEENQIATYDYGRDLKAMNKKKIINLPTGGNHFTRTLLFLPREDKLLISVGSTCNVCNESDWWRAKILIANFDGSDVKEYAKGLRNSVFMAIHPLTGKIWATEMGRDLLGDDIPPDEINIVGPSPDGSGQNSVPNFGWPICYGKNIHDTNFDKNTYIRNPCMEPFEIPSHIDLQAHSAPLGLAFFPEGGSWPEEYQDDLLVAYHGSWNRSEPTGYKVVRMKLDAEGNYTSTEDFISGWLADGGALGRPVDILIQPSGIMYISDDKAGVVYRVGYRK